MKEKLMKKRYGIPALALILAIALSGAAIAGTWVYKTSVTIQKPKSERKKVSVKVSTGEHFSKTAKLDLALPGSYNLKYKLSGDSDDLLKRKVPQSK